MNRSRGARMHDTLKKALSVAVATAMASALMAPVTAAAGVAPPTAITAAYPSFAADGLSGLQLSGDAAMAGSAIRLTPADLDMLGSVFLKQKVHVTNGGAFSTHFSFRMSGPGADGFAFIMRQVAAPTILGGGYLGYQGTPGASIAVEFDSWQNEWDWNDNHVALDMNGVVTNSRDPGFNKDPGFDLDNGVAKYAWIEYTGEPTDIMTVSISETDDRSTAVSIVSNGGRMPILPSGETEGDVWVGFTGATGLEYMTQDVLSWQFDARYNPGLISSDTMTVASVTATASPAAIAVDATSAVTFTAVDTTGAPVAGETLTVSAPDGGAVSSGSVVTDANGQAAVVFTAPAGIRKAYAVRGVSTAGLVAAVSVAVGYARPVVDVQSGATPAYPGIQAFAAPLTTVTDAFDTPILGARVRILGPEYGKESLYCYGWMSPSVSETDTVLTFTESGTPADYENVLRSIIYEGAPVSATRQVEFSVYDGFGWSVPVVKTLAMTPPPAIPTRLIGTARASTDSTWTQGVDADGRARGSSQNAISSTGRYVAFYSGNGFVPQDTNGKGGRGQDWYLKDTQTGAVRLVSVAVDGEQSNSGQPGNTDGAAVSADGRFVAFADYSSNLVAGEFQAPPIGLGSAFATSADTNGVTDVFYRDMLLGTTTRISVDAAGVQGQRGSRSPAMSADGRYVAFVTGNAFVPEDTNGAVDVYVRDMLLGTIRLVSVATDGTLGDAQSDAPSISADGRFVTFQSSASSLVPGDTNEREDIFVHDMQTGETTRVSVDSAGVQAGGASWEPSMSGDGRYVAFSSVATLVPGQTDGAVNVFVRDRETSTTVCASFGESGTYSVGGSSPSISADGRYVAFESRDAAESRDLQAASGVPTSLGGLVAGDLNGMSDIYVRDMVKGGLTMVSVTPSKGPSDGSSYDPSISADGLKVAYDSHATDLVAGDTNHASDVFVGTLAPPELPRTGVTLYRPWTRWTVRRNARALVYGYGTGYHRLGTNVVSLRCQRLENGVWVTRRTATMKATRRISSRRFRWSGYVRLPLSGRWRIVAVHTHAGYQPDVSAPRYFRVR